MGDIILNENLVLLGSLYGGVIFILLWLSMIVWSYRDIKARSRDAFARIFVVLFVALLNIPGVIIYLLLRPRETLSETYERSLEEEALLQEIEAKPTCPGCGQRVHHDWQACPYCHTRLKKPCIKCDTMLNFSWDICPVCATVQTQYSPSESALQTSRHIRPREKEIQIVNESGEDSPWMPQQDGVDEDGFAVGTYPNTVDYPDANN